MRRSSEQFEPVRKILGYNLNCMFIIALCILAADQSELRHMPMYCVRGKTIAPI